MKIFAYGETKNCDNCKTNRNGSNGIRYKIGDNDEIYNPRFNQGLSTILDFNRTGELKFAKGIVLSQQIGFNEGSYASLKDLKNFYRKLNDDKAPSHSLIVRRALDLLSHQVSSYRTHKDIYKEKEIFSILTDLKRKNKGGMHDYQ